MKRVFLLLLTSILLTYSHLIAIETCGKHYSEIQNIRSVSQNAFLDSHRAGGGLFRTSYFFSPDTAAHDIFKWRKNYSEFSVVFREYLSICQPLGIDILYEGYSQVGDLFCNLYSECIANHSSIQALYERSQFYFDRQLYHDCLSDIRSVVESGQWNKENPNYDRTLEDALLIEGKASFETGKYGLAVDKLVQTIMSDPTNKEAYFNIALSWFESGQFDHAIDSYYKSEKSKNFSQVRLKTSPEFKEGILKGLAQGGSEVYQVLLPSLGNATYGLGNTLWSRLALTSSSINAIANFINVCEKMGEEVAEYYKSNNLNQVKGEVEKEIKHLCEKYDDLSDYEKGTLIGYAIGKYGVDIFDGCNTLKAICTFKKLKDAVRVCNLEIMATSNDNKEAIVAEALKYNKERSKYFANVKYNYEEHNKYLLGHQHADQLSIWQHNNPEVLLRRFAGSGQSEKGAFGVCSYQETVNFKEHIGIWKSPDGTIELPTTCGTIHYGKKGAHIVPLKP